MKTSYFEIASDKKIKLAKYPTKVKEPYGSDDEYKKLLGENQNIIAESQTLLYANHERSVLIVFQGMDTAGKDGAIKHVMSGVNPQGCTVVSFKSPTSTESEHDFLWKAHQVVPARGQIGIFNRSYYEEVLIARVHPELLEAQKISKDEVTSDGFWKHRYKDIVNHETYLHRQGYEIVKVFIHISKDEQKRRLLRRFNDPKKLWKISECDVRERAYWDEYQKAYERCIRETSTKLNPWYIVPGDDKENARLMISQILVERFRQLKLTYPKLNAAQKNKIAKLKKQLAAG
jgi:PPK2 family polyphosphate:nucleotide phosphotransferase